MAYTLTGQYVHGNGAPRRGRVKFAPSVAIAGDDTVILPSPLTVDLDSGGSFSVPLVGTDDDAYSPSGWVWSCTEVLDGGRTFSFELTADADIHSLAPIAVPDDDYVTMVPVAREVVAGAGLTGGGSLNADRTFDVGAGVGITVNADDVAVVYGTTAGTAAQGDDSRLSDARTPTAHASSHAAGQADAITVELSQVSDAGGAAALDVGTTTGTVAAGDDSRLSDARTPTAHASSHAAGQSDAITVDLSQVSGLDTALAAKMSNTVADANSVLYAVTDDTPAALAVAASRIVGRKATGDVSAMTAAETLTVLGVTVTHPNTDDVLVKVAGQTVHYDSGWRDLTALVSPPSGTTNVTIMIRRVLHTAYVRFGWNQDATSPSNPVLTVPIPVGFRYAHNTTDMYQSFVGYDTSTRSAGVRTVSGGNLAFYAVANQSPRAQFAYPILNTADIAIPTSLPGTLVSAATA